MPLLEKNSYEIWSIIFERGCLKVEINSFLKNKKDYLSIWRKVFWSTIKNECKNILNIIEILLITPVTNADLEQMFSFMLRVKIEWRNRFANERLDHNLRISEEGVSISNNNPNDGIAKWYIEKVRNFKGAKLWKYLEKWHKLSDSNSAVNIAVYVLSDFEESDDDEDDVEETETWTETFKLTYLVLIFCLWFLKTVSLNYFFPFLTTFSEKSKTQRCSSNNALNNEILWLFLL